MGFSTWKMLLRQSCSRYICNPPTTVPCATYANQIICFPSPAERRHWVSTSGILVGQSKTRTRKKDNNHHTHANIATRAGDLRLDISKSRYLQHCISPVKMASPLVSLLQLPTVLLLFLPVQYSSVQYLSFLFQCIHCSS